MAAISSQRGRRGEQWLEATTGAERVRNRPRFARMADFAPLRLPSGESLQFESKTGASAVPKKVAAAVAQAAGYSPDCIPCAVFRDTGARDGIACLRVSDLCRLLGIGVAQVVGPQLALGRST